jgi:hypothetical protein
LISHIDKTFRLGAAFRSPPAQWRAAGEGQGEPKLSPEPTGDASVPDRIQALGRDHEKPRGATRSRRFQEESRGIGVLAYGTASRTCVSR